MKKFFMAASVLIASLVFAVGVHAEEDAGNRFQQIQEMQSKERLGFMQAMSCEEKAGLLEDFAALGEHEKLEFLETLTNDELDEFRSPIMAILNRIFGYYGTSDDGSGISAEPLNVHTERDAVIRGLLVFSALEAVEEEGAMVARVVLLQRLQNELRLGLEEEYAAGRLNSDEFLDAMETVRHFAAWQIGADFLADDLLALHRGDRSRQLSDVTALSRSECGKWLREEGRAQATTGFAYSENPVVDLDGIWIDVPPENPTGEPESMHSEVEPLTITRRITWTDASQIPLTSVITVQRVVSQTITSQTVAVTMSYSRHGNSSDHSGNVWHTFSAPPPISNGFRNLSEVDD